MGIAKRIILFFAVNALVIVTISIVMGLLGVQPYLTSKGIDYQSLMVFCLVWGFGGAFISLGLSRIMAKWMMGVKVIDDNTLDPNERWLISTVKQLSEKAGLPQTPQVGMYESDDPNAFATGPTKSRALVAVSSGLMRRMNRGELEAVLAHEVAHVANGDMVTMTLLQGVINAFVMFFARVLAWTASQFFDEEKRGVVNFITVLVLEVAFSILGMIVVAAFSRYREFRADSGAADLVGKVKMSAALASLQKMIHVEDDQQSALAALKISSNTKSGFVALFSTHPPLTERIRRLNAV
jgi:heat shock protein HtpX